MTKFFKKSPKSYFGHILGLFAQVGTKNEFSRKKGSNYQSYFQKSEKPNDPFLTKLLDGHTKNQFILLISL